MIMSSQMAHALVKLAGEHGLVIAQKKNSLHGIGRRMKELGIRNVGSYIELVKGGPEEVPHFLQAMAPHITRWFRDTTVWDHYNKLLQYKMSLHDPRGLEVYPVRIWSAACSTGEEAYSALFSANWFKCPEHIVASDFDPVCVEKTKLGVYRTKDTRIPLEWYRMFFYPETRESATVQVKEHVRKRLVTEVKNLLHADFDASSFDVVFMRNVLQYFTIEDRERVLARLVETSRPGAIVYVGAIEGHYVVGSKMAPAFEVVDKTNRPMIFKRR